MKYSISHHEQLYLAELKAHFPSMMGIKIDRIIKTAKFEESYSSRAFKQNLIIKKINRLCDNSYRLTFRQFLRIENGQIKYTPTPTVYINNMIDDAILKFNLFKSFSYKNGITKETVMSEGFESLKFDLVLDIKILPDSFKIDSLQVKAYYALSSYTIRFLICVKDQSFLNQEYYEIRYTSNGDVVTSSNLCRFIKTIEHIWEHPLDFKNLDVESMKTTTDMLLI